MDRMNKFSKISRMTRSKEELATILCKLRGDDSDPKVLAKQMSLLKLCYEIQKIEEEKEAQEAAKEELTTKEEQIVEELKVPVEATPKQRNRHILSWLLDSSSDEE
jgi:hypothetical protein